MLLTIAVFFRVGIVNQSYEELYASFSGSEVRRDHTATVVSFGKGMKKQMLVNGKGITALTPITKVMGHLPLILTKDDPASALVICFGMGTTYRSLLSWDIQVSAVELVPSVKDAFGFYFDDASRILDNPKGKIIIDDGRRFLKRTLEHFDVITIDPPPPVETAGSSLLYSEEFYDLIKIRLTPGGILQQWFPGGERIIMLSILKALSNSFPHVKCFKPIHEIC